MKRNRFRNVGIALFTGLLIAVKPYAEGDRDQLFLEFFVPAAVFYALLTLADLIYPHIPFFGKVSRIEEPVVDLFRLAFVLIAASLVLAYEHLGAAIAAATVGYVLFVVLFVFLIRRVNGNAASEGNG